MTVANGFNRLDDGPLSTMRRSASNVFAALKLLARPVRPRPAPSWPLAPRAFAITAGIAAAVLVILMMTIDAVSVRSVGYVPRWLVSVLDEITDYGKSSWFLWPLGLLFLALASLPPILTPFSQRVLAAIMVRVGFIHGDCV
jgi:hypothetical protein